MSVASRHGGPGLFGGQKISRNLKIFGGHALEMLGNEGNALFSYVLHHKHGYIEHKIGRMLCSIWIKNLCSLLRVRMREQPFIRD